MIWVRRIFLIVLGILFLYMSALIVTGLRNNIFPTDVIVILGNAVSPDGVPSPRLAARLDVGAKMYHNGLGKKIIVSGATGVEGFNEAIAMRNYLVTTKNIAADDIIIDMNGVDTLATARFTKKYMDENNLQSVMVVSQYYHIPRTAMIMRRIGIPVVGRACSMYAEWRDIFSVPREMIALPFYAFRRI